MDWPLFEAMIELTGVDEDPSALGVILDKFRQDSGTQLDQVRAALGRDDAFVRFQLHKLKGATGSLSLRRAARWLIDLEREPFRLLTGEVDALEGVIRSALDAIAERHPEISAG